MRSTYKVSKLKRIVNIILFIVFILFAVIQLNDPDPIIWFTIYAIVAFICLYVNYRKISRTIILILIFGFSVYAAIHFSYFMDWLQIENKEELFGEMVYEKPYLEGTREFLGLLIATIALAFQLKK